MKESTSDYLDLNKRQTHSRQHETPPFLDGEMLDQLHTAVKSKTAITADCQIDKSKQFLDKTDSIGVQDSAINTISKD